MSIPDRSFGRFIDGAPLPLKPCYFEVMSAFDPAGTYVCLSPDGSATTIPVTADFWPTIATRTELAEGRLVAAFPCKATWAQWEMHPHGEEILVLLSGKVTMVFDEPEHKRERNVDLEQGLACVVPHGVWHRAVVHEPGMLLGITYGRGTEHRPR